MPHLAAALFALSVLAAPAAAQPTPPAATVLAPVTETPASQQARRLLEALTTGDEASFLRFVHEAYPSSSRGDADWLDLRGALTHLKLHGVTSASASDADLAVFDANRDGWARLVVSVDPSPPHAITAFSMRMGRRPADVPAPPKLAPRDLAAAAKAKVDAEAAADRFAGAVLVAKDGQVIFSAARGLADRETGRANTLTTQFRFGSMGKMFTEVAILQLARAGKLDLAAPIGRYLPGYPNREIAEGVTVDNLMTHTGGTGDIFGPEFDAHRLSLKDPLDYLVLFGARAPLAAPGQGLAYSNYGFILLGRIVETVSGQSYDDYLQEHVFAPAGMTATGNRPETDRMPKRATGYMRGRDGLTSAAGTQPFRGTPAGGGYSTVGDMLAFANALMAHRLLNADDTARLTTGMVTVQGGMSVRYDFSGMTSEGQRYFGHAGGAPGMNGELRIFPASGYTIVVLANRDPSIAGSIAGFISDRTP